MPQDDYREIVTRAVSGGRHRAFDTIKLEFAIVVLIALGAALVCMRLDGPAWLELLVLAAIGFGCGGWIALRTRNVLRAYRREDTGSPRSGQGNRP